MATKQDHHWQSSSESALRDGDQGGTLHGILPPEEEPLRAEIVQPGTVRAEPPISLKMEIVLVVSRVHVALYEWQPDAVLRLKLFCTAQAPLSTCCV
jgi:hypothetical protein